MINLMYSTINVGWFVMWNDQVLAIKPTRDEAIHWLDSRGLSLNDDIGQ